jgi:hypothetical protein
MRPVSDFFDQQAIKLRLKTEENVQENFSPDVAMKTAPAAQFMWSRDFFTTYLFDRNRT